MTDVAAPYPPPSGCRPTDVERWRAMVGAARLLVARPTAAVPGFRKIVKEGRRAAIPTAERHLGSVFYRLSKALHAWPPLDPAMRPARATELGPLAEAVAQMLGDPCDAELAARVLNPVRPRADLDN